jgi:hypothetical protein
VEGSFRSVEVEAGRLVVAPAEGDPVTVGFSRRTKFYLGGQEAKEPTFQADQAIVVLYRQRERGLIRARAIFARDSWQAYAQAAIAAEKANPAGITDDIGDASAEAKEQ